MTQITVAGITSAGKVRSHNEDCLGLSDWIRQRPMTGPVQLSMCVGEPVLFVVADGMGGHAHGETASRMAVTRLLAQSPALSSEQAVVQAIQETNAAMYELMATDAMFRGMGTTLAGVVVCPEKIIGFNVGDSRIYQFRHGYMQLLSVDDTVDFPYALTTERTGLASHAITQSIGGASEPTDVTPHVWSHPLEGSQRFLLCTDGLTDMLDQDAMEASHSGDIKTAISALHEQALAQGGHDNVSVLILDVTV